MPQAFTSWEAIYETLRVAFPKERYHMGATLVGVNDPGNGQAVSAEIKGHGHIKADLLVCADGAQSPTRRRLLPSQSTRAMSPGAARSTKRMRQKSLCAFSTSYEASAGLLGDNLKTVVFGCLQNIDHRFIDDAPNCATIFCGLSLDEIDADEWHIRSLGNRLSRAGRNDYQR
jgi:hypothetical protein